MQNNIRGVKLMVFSTFVGIAMIHSCYHDKEMETLQDLIQQPLYQLQTENIFGQEAPEKFYEINGQRFYLEIDGRPVEEYVR